jgi:hypothetical protein
MGQMSFLPEMGRGRWLAVVLVVSTGLPSVVQGADAPVIRLSQKSKSDLQAVFEVKGLDPAVVQKLAQVNWKAAEWQGLFAVYVRGNVSAESSKPAAFLGTYEIKDRVLRFVPRFPLVRGVRYRAEFHPSRLPGQTVSGQKPLVAEFLIAKPLSAAKTVVEHVYPSAETLPENQLKFYLHFSAPMSQGDVYRHIKLLRASGKPVELPFLELEKELWDAEGKRFTLIIDPGRIKRGLKPREDLGPVLERGKSFTLVIHRGWLDAEGNPLKESYRKTFRVAGPEDRCPDSRQWEMQPPPAGSRKTLTVIFPRPMDHALLLRALWVTDAAGRVVPGTPLVSDTETRWHFRPDRPWGAGKYQLVAATTLEDLAGNNLERPFEVDVFRPIQKQVKVKTIRRPFEVRCQGSK